MSKQYPGGLITKTPVTPSGPYETSTASGIWTLDQQAYWKKLGQWPTAGSPAPDAQFNYVTMLLHGDGTNGAQNNTFLDSSTNNFTITRNGNTTQGSFSPYGSNWSNYFTGSNYLTAAGSTQFYLTGNCTVECWINIQYLSDNNGVWFNGTFGSDSDRTQMVVRTNGSIDVYSANGGSVLYYIQSATGVISAGVWYHTAFVTNGSTVTLYVNGVSVATATSAGTPGSYPNFYTGYARAAAADAYTTGYISNIRVVNGTAVYTSAFTPPTSPLTAITNTQLLTCQSNRFIDNSTNNFSLTVTGAPSVQRFNPFGASTAYSTSVIGGSGYFDGTGDYLSVANNTNIDVGTGAFTIEAWVYRQGGSSDWRVMGGSVTGSGFFGGRSDKLGLGRSNVAWDLESSTNVYNNNGWTHIVYVRDGSGNLSIFSNGVRVADTTGNSNDYGLNSGSLQVAAEKGSQTWVGYMSNFRLVKGSAIYSPTSTTLTVPTAPLTAVSGTGLLLYYTNGAIFDNAMMNDLETVGNAQISTSVVKYGTGSLAFDGSGDWLYQPSNLSAAFRTGDFTVEFWINPTNWTGTYIGVVATTTSNALWIGKNVSNFVLQLYGVADIVTYGTFPTTATWTHVAFSRSGTSVKMFYNGTQVASGTSSADFIAGNFYVGTDGGGGNLTGYIDDLRITKGYARYTTTFTPPTQAFPNFGPT